MMNNEEEKTKDHPSLSPNAAPFHPYYEPCHIHIYNEGVPSLVLMSESDLSGILHGIQDDALDDRFPPDARDAAELEAVEAFVETMAELAMMEDRDQKARFDFAHIKKRWEARRARGLVNKPRPARHMVDRNEHQSKGRMSFSKTCTSLVPYSRHTSHKLMRHDMTLRDRSLQIKKSPLAMAPTQRAVIQQPRKQY